MLSAWRQGSPFLGAAILLNLIALEAFAYNPPEDSAGGITLRIEGPQQFVFSPEGFLGTIQVENTTAAEVKGSVRLAGIDGFTFEPAQFEDLTIPAKQTVSQNFRAKPGPTVFNAHYPIHAFGEFRTPGGPVSLHPILILVVSGAPQPKTASWDWSPLVVPGQTTLALEEWPVARAVFQVFEQNAEVMRVGWRGSHPTHRGSFEVFRRDLAGQNRPVIGIHPPWDKGQAGTALVEFPLMLPQNSRITFAFALGMVPEGQSDGVTFRVRVAEGTAPDGDFGQIVFERHTTARAWEPHEVDLSAFAGRFIRLQLESHPGPQKNTGWDSSFWGEPTLVTQSVERPDASSAESRPAPVAVGPVMVGDFRGEVRVTLGKRGLLDAEVEILGGQQRVGFRGFEITVFGSRLDRERSATSLLAVEARNEPKPDGGQRLVVTHRFQNAAGHFELVGTLETLNGVLVVKWRVEKAPEPRPWIHVHLEDVALGSWSEEAHRVYAGPGNVVQKPGPFSLGFDGHRLSTSFVGMELSENLSVVQGCDNPPSSFVVNPQSRHYSLHVAHDCQLTIIPAVNVWEGVKKWREVNGLRASSGVPQLAGRFVFDLWGGRYRESAEALKRAFRYGLTDSVVIWHNWQRWGYDYRLPEIFPPNPDLGTLEDMQFLLDTCRSEGVLFAPHDNYIDFYPDAEGFSYLNTIAFHSNGQPVRAWFNEYRQAQSYRYRADAVEPFLRNNLKLIAQHMKPTAYFIDVWSSIDPYDYWTADGRFFDKIYTRNSWGEHFAWIRELLGNNAPQISESGHDQLIGWLDGATTNHLRVGKPLPGYYQWSVWNWDCEDAERVPWFDAAHHDRFALHGAGYSGRYQAGLDDRLHGIFSDDYITTEVLTGHPAMVPEPFGPHVIRKYWLLAALGRALALDRIEHVEFVGGDIHRLHVRWASGIETWCNRGESDWEVAGTVLPKYGFLAKSSAGSGAQAVFSEASIARREGLIVEFSQTPQSVYVNARKQYLGPLPIRPRATGFQGAGSSFEVATSWDIRVPIRPGWVPFAHFCDERGEIIFQGQFSPRELPESPGEWKTKIFAKLPENLPPEGELELRVGVYRPRDGRRLSLAGPNDGNSRVKLGKITWKNQTVTAWEPLPDQPDPLLARQNPEGRVVNFGPVATAYGVRLSRQDNGLLVVPLPVEGEPVELTIHWAELPWDLALPRTIEFYDHEGTVTRREDIATSDAIKVVVNPSEWGCVIH